MQYSFNKFSLCILGIENLAVTRNEQDYGVYIPAREDRHQLNKHTSGANKKVLWKQARQTASGEWDPILQNSQGRNL